MGDWRGRIKDAYWGSLTMTPDTARKALAFFELIAKKICRTSQDALSAYLKTRQVQLEPERETALTLLGWED
jgi:hypothetical protein